MQSIAHLIPHPGFAAMTSRWAAWLRQAWDELNLDADERFLREARDLADLESRLRRLERGSAERFGPVYPSA